jgi:hypothetical protein
MRFSQKYGIVPPKQIQVEAMDEVLITRLTNAIQGFVNSKDIDEKIATINYIIDKYACFTNINKPNYDDYIRLLKQAKEKWYLLYDIIDLLFEYEDKNRDPARSYQKELQLTRSINEVLEEEKAGYRIVNEEIIPITNPIEISAIEEASSTDFKSVNIHIDKALQLYSDRHQPDYENSIKESISAVESICCIITGLSGAQATLGKAIKKLKEHGVVIHSAMENAFSSLFGYTSDADGIRHGGIDFTNAPAEDAKFMLVSCSAFVNYLIEKYSKVKGAL